MNNNKPLNFNSFVFIIIKKISLRNILIKIMERNYIKNLFV